MQKKSSMVKTLTELQHNVKIHNVFTYIPEMHISGVIAWFFFLMPQLD